MYVTLLFWLIFNEGLFGFLDLFLTPELLESSLQCALDDRSIRGDDLAFVVATQTWSRTVAMGSMEGYRSLFEQTSSFFDRSGVDVHHVRSQCNELMQLITQKWVAHMKIDWSIVYSFVVSFTFLGWRRNRETFNFEVIANLCDDTVHKAAMDTTHSSQWNVQ